MQIKKTFLVILVVSFLLIPNVLANASDLLALINAERARLGRDPLTFDARLNTAAQLHSNDQLANDYFDHYSQNGDSPFDRMAAAGYIGAGGENIVWHDGGEDDQRAFDLWVGSSGHYNNMVSSSWNIAGIGIASGTWSLPPYTNLYSTVYTLNLGYSGSVGCTDGDTRSCGSTDVGRCEFGTQTCSGGSWGGCVGAVYPIAEVCGNGIDDDCDGNSDDVDLDCCDSHDSSACYNNDVYWYDSCGRREDRRQDCGSAGCDSGVCCTSQASSACYNNDVYWISSCNVVESKKEECFADGCVAGECVVCDSQDSFACYNHDVYWYDSCDDRESKKEECGLAGCSGNACCTSHTGTTCYNGDVYWHSSCNYIEEKIEECYGQGCVDSTCVTCDSHDSYACYGGDSYWYDSCDRREEKREECGTAGCDGGECCISEANSQCYSNDVYWYSSCGVRQDKKEECYADGCSEGACVVCDEHDSYTCYGNDLYWYDSCGRREEKKEECGRPGCQDNECCESESYFECYRGDVYWYDSCGDIESKKEECYSNGCAEGECVVCEDHADYECYYNSVYWYDSCGRREERKEYCRYGCEDNECNPPPCGDNDKDGYVDVACGGEDCDDTNEQIYPGSVEICNSVDEDCDGDIDDDCKENLIVLSPEDGDEFNTRRVLFDLDVTHVDGSVMYDIGSGWRRFCSRPDRCERYLGFADGYNDISFMLTDFNGDVYEDTLNIFVDSRKPRIRRQEPRNGRYANGDFTVMYTEDFPESVDLYLAEFGSEEFDKVASSDECGGGRNAECTLEYDVSEFDGEQIQYYFSVSDKVSAAEGRAYTVTVDITNPDFTSFSFEKISEVYDRYQLNTELSETVRLEYQYPGMSFPRALCTRCDHRIINFYFREKPEYVDFFITDMAGNGIDRREYLE